MWSLECPLPLAWHGFAMVLDRLRVSLLIARGRQMRQAIGHAHVALAAEFIHPPHILQIKARQHELRA